MAGFIDYLLHRHRDIKFHEKQMIDLKFHVGHFFIVKLR